MTPKPPTLWIDVEDLFNFAARSLRVNGIQRVCLELLAAAVRLPAGARALRFVRHSADGKRFIAVSWAELEALAAAFKGVETHSSAHLAARAKADGATGTAPDADDAPAGPLDPMIRPMVALVGHEGRAIADAGVDLWRVVLAFLRRQVEALGIAVWLAKGTAVVALRAAGLRRGTAVAARAEHEAAAPMQPGDVVVALGGLWCHPAYGALIADTKRAYGVRFALLVHDLIPIRRPEYCHPGFVRDFTAWLDGTLPQADRVLANSRSTARDVEDHARAIGLALAGPVPVIPFGTGFALTHAIDAPAPEWFPEAGSYALFVSTIDGRKNHAFLFRVWRRLLEALPAERVPTLVFAGGVGGQVADLMQQLENTDYLGGKVMVIHGVSDGELAALYRGARFTLYPSLYEGWGLPVSESLGFGRPCLASNATSLPEAGGSLARYFDPEDVGDAYRKILAVIEDPEDLRRWQEQVAREFRPVPWSAGAAALLAELGVPAEAAREPEAVQG